MEMAGEYVLFVAGLALLVAFAAICLTAAIAMLGHLYGEVAGIFREKWTPRKRDNSEGVPF